MPFEFDKMRGVGEREPWRIYPVSAIIQQAGPNDVISSKETELNSDYLCCLGKALEDIVPVAIRHGDGVGIEVETSVVGGFRVRCIVYDIDGVIIIDHGLQAKRFH